MNIRSITLALVACAAITGLHAQGTTAAPTSAQQQRAESRHDRLVRELGLDASQAERMKAVDDAYADAMNTLRGSTNDRAVMTTESTKLREKHEVDLKAIFTAEQWEKYSANRRTKPATAPTQTK